jgi:hypothetical protein
MGGDLVAESIPGQGSTFTLTVSLPVVTSDAAQPPETDYSYSMMPGPSSSSSMMMDHRLNDGISPNSGIMNHSISSSPPIWPTSSGSTYTASPYLPAGTLFADSIPTPSGVPSASPTRTFARISPLSPYGDITPVNISTATSITGIGNLSSSGTAASVFESLAATQGSLQMLDHSESVLLNPNSPFQLPLQPSPDITLVGTAATLEPAGAATTILDELPSTIPVAMAQKSSGSSTPPDNNNNNNSGTGVATTPPALHYHIHHHHIHSDPGHSHSHGNYTHSHGPAEIDIDHHDIAASSTRLVSRTLAGVRGLIRRTTSTMSTTPRSNTSSTRNRFMPSSSNSDNEYDYDDDSATDASSTSSSGHAHRSRHQRRYNAMAATLAATSEVLSTSDTRHRRHRSPSPINNDNSHDKDGTTRTKQRMVSEVLDHSSPAGRHAALVNVSRSLIEAATSTMSPPSSLSTLDGDMMIASKSPSIRPLPRPNSPLPLPLPLTTSPPVLAIPSTRTIMTSMTSLPARSPSMSPSALSTSAIPASSPQSSVSSSPPLISPLSGHGIATMSTAAPGSTRPRILLVEDSVINQKLFIRMFTRRNGSPLHDDGMPDVDIDVASNGQQAVEMVIARGLQLGLTPPVPLTTPFVPPTFAAVVSAPPSSLLTTSVSSSTSISSIGGSPPSPSRWAQWRLINNAGGGSSSMSGSSNSSSSTSSSTSSSSPLSSLFPRSLSLAASVVGKRKRDITTTSDGSGDTDDATSSTASFSAPVSISSSSSSSVTLSRSAVAAAAAAATAAQSTGGDPVAAAMAALGPVSAASLLQAASTSTSSTSSASASPTESSNLASEPYPLILMVFKICLLFLRSLLTHVIAIDIGFKYAINGWLFSN